MQNGGAVAAIKNVVRGVIAIPFNQTSATAIIAAVNPAKSELRVLGFTSAEGSFSASGPSVIFPSVALTNATTITASRINFNVGACNVSWELTEFY